MNKTSVVFDPEALLDKLDRDEELARELLVAFVEDAPLRLNTLVQAVSDGSGSSAVEAAHSLKGMCGVIRVQPLVDLALSLERLGQSNDLERLQSLVNEFRSTLSLVLLQVTDYLQS